MSADNSLRLATRCPAAWGTAVLTVLAAVVGGLAASAAGPRHVSLAVAMAISLVIGLGAAAFAGRRDAVAVRAAGTTAGELSGEHPVPDDSQGPADMLRLLSGGAQPTWWEAARQQLPPAASVVPAPPPELASYLETAQVAQCPNCGRLTLDATGVTGGWALNCPACSHTWTWRPGTPWPDVMVLPRRSLAPGQPPASSKSADSHGPAAGPRTHWR